MSNNPEIKHITMPKLYRYFYLISGFLLVAIGVIGIFLPVLPTTIFLILASACFVKSSPKANDWLRNHRILGMYVKNYQDKAGLTLRAKIFNIAFLWIMILLSAFYLTNEFYIKIILIAIAAGVTLHILMIKTKIQ
ncbi:YbaN family protein [Ignavibacterium album]|uniref:YbaN family protein n=2 Tax=Ignavibacterium album TaxID=591197 RepID=UPI0026EB3A6D|nr:YbaN family protein [Ignavibacterium album]